jgi:hypothetical protein
MLPGARHAGWARRLALDAAADRLANGGDLLLSTDADTIVSPAWIVQTVATIEQGYDAVAGHARSSIFGIVSGNGVDIPLDDMQGVSEILLVIAQFLDGHPPDINFAGRKTGKVACQDMAIDDGELLQRMDVDGIKGSALATFLGVAAGVFDRGGKFQRQRHGTNDPLSMRNIECRRLLSGPDCPHLV